MNSRDTWLAVASKLAAIDLRIGSTRPMPMNDTMAANANTQTASGCLGLPCEVSGATARISPWGSRGAREAAG